MTRDQAIEMARKLKALAEKAEGGEKSAAADKLKKFCHKHGLDEDEYATEQIRVSVAYKNAEERSLLSNVMCMVMESDNVKGTDKNNTFSFLCTPYQFDLIKDAYAYYRVLYREYCEAVLIAMVAKNEIVNTKKNEKPFSMEEMNEEEKKEWEETMKQVQQPPQEEPPKETPPEETATSNGVPQPPRPPPQPSDGAKKQDRIARLLFIMEPSKW